MVLGLLGSAVMLAAAAVGIANQRWRQHRRRGPYCKLCWDYDCPNPHNNLTKHQEGET